jgi:predicted nucleotidyltransferase component of viral defense system
MKLHDYIEDFQDLIQIVSQEKHIPASAVERDYYIVMLLQKLEKSDYADKCVFKGGTSLSKCYPGSIERLSEDIDLTFLGMDMSDAECEKEIKRIIAIMTVGVQTEKIPGEGNKHNKSRYVWFNGENNKIKLEIGSTVRPDPYSEKSLKTYIQEHLENNGFTEDVEKFELEAVVVNVLNIERTFIDKLMSVKRHAICGTLDKKVRHIYDVTRLYYLDEVQSFFQDTEELKRLVKLTKDTDSYYLEKRNIPNEYNPLGAYAFDSWKDKFDPKIKERYESLHEELLYTDEQQDLDEAIEIFKLIDRRLQDIGE